MDLDEFRSILETSGLDVWSLINTAISVAATDYADELRHRRDGIVERLYYSELTSRCQNCNTVDRDTLNANDHVSSKEKRGSPLSVYRDEEEEEEEEEDRDQYGGLFDDEQVKILTIKEHLEDPDQSEESVVNLLQSLADMDITFKALKETDIGRHVSRLRKHSSGEVRRLVKQLVRKWKDLVDEWMRLNTPGGGEVGSSHVNIIDGDSPQRKVSQNGYLQVPDFGYSPNPHNGSSGSDKKFAELEAKAKPIPRCEAPIKAVHSKSVASCTSTNKPREHKESPLDAERLASARKRLLQNYKEAENGRCSAFWFSPHPIDGYLVQASGFGLIFVFLLSDGIAKKQRTVQVMDIHDIPKPKNKNVFFAKNKATSHGGRHW